MVRLTWVMLLGWLGLGWALPARLKAELLGHFSAFQGQEEKVEEVASIMALLSRLAAAQNKASPSPVPPQPLLSAQPSPLRPLPPPAPPLSTHLTTTSTGPRTELPGLSDLRAYLFQGYLPTFRALVSPHTRCPLGDILLTPMQVQRLKTSLNKLDPVGGRRRVKRKLYKGQEARWSFPIRYRMDESLGAMARKRIREAVGDWERDTCVEMRELGAAEEVRGDWLEFFQGSGCYSAIGRTRGRQGVSIGRGCERRGIVAHEVGHALGLWHEQSRPDAARHLRVLPHNVSPAYLPNFLARLWSDVETLGVPYDVGSVLHYGPTAFARRWGQPTLETRDPRHQRTIGQRQRPSFYDVAIVNRAYCSQKCRGAGTACGNGGYAHPRQCSRCLCRWGLGGSVGGLGCEEAGPAAGLHCGGRLEAGPEWAVVSPPSPAQRDTHCSWLIVAPKGHRIALQFQRPFHFSCGATCQDFVELNNSSDIANTGYRFCCSTPPQGTFYSHGDRLLLLFSLNYQPGASFTARYRLYPHGDYSANLSALTQPTTAQPVTPLPKPFSTTATPPPPTPPKEALKAKKVAQVIRLLKPEMEELPKRIVVEKRVGEERAAGEWGEWSECSRSCGGCGIRWRRRVVRGSGWAGGARRQEYGRCGLSACRGQRTECGRLGWRGGEAVAEGGFACWRPSCCGGLAERRGVCVPADSSPGPKRRKRLGRQWSECLGPALCGGCGLQARETSPASVLLRRCAHLPCVADRLPSHLPTHLPSATRHGAAKALACTDVFPKGICKRLPFPPPPSPTQPCCPPLVLSPDRGACIAPDN